MPRTSSEGEMIVGVRMRVLGVFLLAALGCRLARARIVTKCELREQLMEELKQVPEKAQQAGLSGEEFVGKVVCYAKLVSDFNTSAVNVRTRDEGDSTTVQPPAPRTAENSHSFCGVFQLSGHICETDCKDLVDEDIRDDTQCLLKIFISFLDEGFVSTLWEEIKRVVKPTLETCGNVQASEYFAECT